MSKSLAEIFKNIKDTPDRWQCAQSGKAFEELLEVELKKKFSRIIDTSDIIKLTTRIKSDIINKTNTNTCNHPYIENKEYQNCFISQPFGSQQYPDFLVFTKKYVIPIEVKYSKNKSNKPIWNSNLPKSNGLYIFGSYGLQDITFFVGDNIITTQERKLLIDFFDDIVKTKYNIFKKKLSDEFKSNNLSLERGFDVYIRKAFQQNKLSNPNAELDYFKAKNRNSLEDTLINFLNNLE